jgi:hypothetical protein
MTLTLASADKVDIRRFCGYGALGDTRMGGGSLMYWQYFSEYNTLEYRMNNLSDDEIALLQGQMLPQLNQLENDIFVSRSNLDTEKAAVWTRNDHEPWDRQDLFNYHRVQLCAFMQLDPGPFFRYSSGSGSSVRMVR